MNQESVNDQNAEENRQAGQTKGAESLVLCSIDGMRPDALCAADTPAMDTIIARGAICWQARTVVPSATLPAHISMLHGIDAPRRGLNIAGLVSADPVIPGLLDIAHEAGLQTGAFYNWE
ncbi:MAG: alkaline phosphatase family protein, partial [Armatimonadetes bacterium]|nr:alkaline phosphatase family protein [Armatimonadota bacterium]